MLRAGGVLLGATGSDLKAALTKVCQGAEDIAKVLVGKGAITVLMPQECDWQGILESGGPQANAMLTTAATHAILVAVAARIWEQLPIDNIYTTKPSSLLSISSEEELRLVLQVEKLRAQQFIKQMESFTNGAQQGSTRAATSASGGVHGPYVKLLQHYKDSFLRALAAGVPHLAPLEAGSTSPACLFRWINNFPASEVLKAPELQAFVRDLVEAAVQCSILVSLMHTRLFKLYVPGYGVVRGSAAAAVAAAAANSGAGTRQPNNNAWEKHREPDMMRASKGVVLMSKELMSSGRRLAASQEALPGDWVLFCQQPGVIKLAENVLQLPELAGVSTAIIEAGNVGGGSGKAGAVGRVSAQVAGVVAPVCCHVTANIKARVCIVTGGK